MPEMLTVTPDVVDACRERIKRIDPDVADDPDFQFKVEFALNRKYFEAQGVTEAAYVRNKRLADALGSIEHYATGW